MHGDTCESETSWWRGPLTAHGHATKQRQPSTHKSSREIAASDVAYAVNRAAPLVEGKKARRADTLDQIWSPYRRSVLR